MPTNWKKSWSVRSYPEAVARMLKLMPQMYEDGCADGVLAWMGRTFAHQRKDLKPKSPKLTVDKGDHLVFQHDLVNQVTYTVEIQPDQDGTRVTVEVKTAGPSKEGGSADTILSVFYVLTKALEPPEGS